MKFSRQKLVVSLYPNRIAAGVFHAGKLLREESISLDPDDWRTAWTNKLAPFDSALRQILSRLRLPSKTPISVLYHSPTAMIRVDENGGSKTEAQAASVLQFEQSDESGMLYAAHAITNSAKNKADWIVVALSERKETANAVFAWVTRCGGSLRAIQPSQSVVIQDAIRSIRDADERQATCVIGHEWSAVVSGDRHGVELARIFELGFRPLADVYSRSFQPGNTIPNQDAEKALFEFGIPIKRGTVPDEIRRELLPQLSPIIQRLSVEIKQTLRFGLAGRDAPAVLVLEGRGSAIPELPHVLTEGVDMHVRSAASEATQSTQSAVFLPNTPEHRFGMLAVNRLELVPVPAVLERTARRFRNAMTIGACVAAIALAAEFAWIHERSRTLDPEFEAISSGVTSIVRDREQIEHASSIAKRAGKTAIAIKHASVTQPNIAMLLTALSESTTPETKFSGIDFRFSNDQVIVVLSGHAKSPNAEQAAKSLQQTVESLEQAESIGTVEMTATSNDLDEASGEAFRRFTLSATALPEPSPFDHLARFASVQEDE